MAPPLRVQQGLSRQPSVIILLLRTDSTLLASFHGNKIDALRAIDARIWNTAAETATICCEFRKCSCIDATLHPRSKLNRTFEGGHRL
jgi:hypothetical protein